MIYVYHMPWPVNFVSCVFKILDKNTLQKTKPTGTEDKIDDKYDEHRKIEKILSWLCFRPSITVLFSAFP